MPTIYPNRPPRTSARMVHHLSPHANPLYGYGYNPAWPSILSIAHDEEDGGAVFIILDRPCILTGSGVNLPLLLPAEGTLSIVYAASVVPVKVRVVMSDAVPAQARWQWLGGICDLVDPMAGKYVNAGGGICRDFPGPYLPPPPPPPPPPPAPLEVIAAVAIGGSFCTMTFDRGVDLLSGVPVDDAMLFDGQPALVVTHPHSQMLQFELAASVGPGSTWQIMRQPDWIGDEVAWPRAGVLA